MLDSCLPVPSWFCLFFRVSAFFRLAPSQKIAERLCSKLDDQDGGIIECIETFGEDNNDGKP